MKRNLVAYSWYDQGTRILDISNPAKPIQVAYYRPDGGVSWAPYFHRGYIYVADHERGVEVLKATRGSRSHHERRGAEAVAPARADGPRVVAQPAAGPEAGLALPDPGDLGHA